MDDVAEAVQYAYSRRDEIKGLKKIEKPGRSRFEPALFASYKEWNQRKILHIRTTAISGRSFSSSSGIG